MMKNLITIRKSYFCLALLFAGTFFLTPQDSNAVKRKGRAQKELKTLGFGKDYNNPKLHATLKAVKDAGVAVDKANIEAAVDLIAAGVAVNGDNVAAAVALQAPAVNLAVDADNVAAAAGLQDEGIPVSIDNIAAITHADVRVASALVEYFKKTKQVPGVIAVCTGFSAKSKPSRGGGRNPKFSLLWAKQGSRYPREFYLHKSVVKVTKDQVIGCRTLDSSVSTGIMRGCLEFHVLTP